ncbi:MAG TPA: hypothetical protein VFA68_11725 [Terriglobales bacterium]|nr:hypothetical protein [Terriglobales bacterium]
MGNRILSPEQLAGVEEKLKRAEECFDHLEIEIAAHLKYPGSTHGDDRHEAVSKALQHSRRPVPLRFGVMAGEIVHHLRSVLDHLVWMLSSDAYRLSHETAIGFPVLTKKPTNADKLRSYERKINGITCDAAIELIERLQPYNAPDPLDDPLAIIHKLDRVDKHHTLVLVECSWGLSLTLPRHFGTTFVLGVGTKAENDILSSPLAEQLKVDFSLYVAFNEVGSGKAQPVIPGLSKLIDRTRQVVLFFSEL